MKTWFHRKSSSSDRTLCKKASFAQRQWHLIDGHWRARSEILSAVYLVVWGFSYPVVLERIQAWKAVSSSKTRILHHTLELGWRRSQLDSLMTEGWGVHGRLQDHHEQRMPHLPWSFFCWSTCDMRNLRSTRSLNIWLHFQHQKRGAKLGSPWSGLLRLQFHICLGKERDLASLYKIALSATDSVFTSDEKLDRIWESSL